MTPPALPDPPGDYSLLTGFPVLPKETLPPVLYRIHKAHKEAEWFGDPSKSREFRFDPPVGVEEFGTCYLGTDELTAFIETFGEFPIITTAMVAERAIATVEVPPDPRLANMASPVIASFGLDRRISTGDDYEVTQRWAHALRQAGFTGVFYESRHYAGHHGSCVALFGDPGYQPTQLQVLDDEAIPMSLMRQASNEFHLPTIPSTMIGR